MVESKFLLLKKQGRLSMQKCQVEGKHPSSCSYMRRKSCSARFMRPINVINTPEIGEESFRRISDDYATVK